MGIGAFDPNVRRRRIVGIDRKKLRRRAENLGLVHSWLDPDPPTFDFPTWRVCARPWDWQIDG